MRFLRLLALMILGAHAAQAQNGLDYRGLEPGIRLSTFLDRVEAIVPADSVICQTSRRTAHIMECGVAVEPADGREIYLSIQVIAGTVSMLAVTTGGDNHTITNWQEELTHRFGDGTLTRRRMIQWVRGETVARLTWRGSGDQQRIALTITHDPTMARIVEFLP